jgi:hypothetical protein
MLSTRHFALVYGIVFLVVGIAGFVPAFTVPHQHPDVAVNAWMGLLFGLFAVNVLHNLVHILFGVWGLAASGSESAARVFARSTAIIYAALVVLGLIGAFNLHTVFGLVPLYGHDLWLHAVLALGAAYFGWWHTQPKMRPAA